METGTTASSGKHPRKGRGSAPKPTLIELAHSALKESSGDETAAALSLRDYVLDDLGYVDEICALIIHRVAKDGQGADSGTARRHAASTITADPDSVSALASVVGRSLLNFKLPRGMPVLRDATAADIEVAIGRYGKTARTMTARVQWLEAIMARLKPGQKVGAAVDELTARKLYEEANAS